MSLGSITCLTLVSCDSTLVAYRVKITDRYSWFLSEYLSVDQHWHEEPMSLARRDKDIPVRIMNEVNEFIETGPLGFGQQTRTTVALLVHGDTTARCELTRSS
jgi:hypothetical protein